MHEFEAVFTGIDPVALEAKIAAIGAVKAGEYLYRRKVYDYPDFRMRAENAWVRLRDEGDKVMLAYKRGVKDAGFEEIQFAVENFDTAAMFLERIGLREKSYQENRRIRYAKGTVEFDLDFWPELEPFLEIEADNFEAVDAAARELGLDPAAKRFANATDLYKEKGIDPDDYTRITFEGLVKK